jgi:hypothetical protein
MPGPWLVEYHAEAISELLKLRDRKQRTGVETAAVYLCRKGPYLTHPHMKRVAGTRKLCELRPGGGQTPIRPLYFRLDERTFKVVAIAPEAMVDPRGFRSAVERARRRALDDYGVLA